MFTAVFGAVELGLIYGIMALGVYLSFRILDFPDLTVDGSYVTGAAVAAIMITSGYSPLLATFCALVVGFIAGCLTGTLHTKGKINPLLSGILMMIALYSINLRIMGNSPNISLMREDSLLTIFSDWWGGLPIDNAVNGALTSIGLGAFTPSSWSILVFVIVLVLAVKLVIDFFLKTESGLALRATGDNPKMIRSLSANTDRLKIIGLGMSNAFVALAGATAAQYTKFADVNMGIGMIIIGLASVIIGEALFGKGSLVKITFAVIIGAVVYRIIIALALRVEFLEAGDLRLITAVIVICALVVPMLIEQSRNKSRKAKRLKAIQQERKEASSLASPK
ncbi:ABC transporter permease [Shouchella clausii]|uniref:ABC transporter permease n=1 Tax=Shouchella clausii TaxID=79880 RepID=UPI000BA764EE|nr:ABC transporter permease [Shouchella clausii]PAD91284.1 ABC transporter permease [Shouchella clausii]